MGRSDAGAHHCAHIAGERQRSKPVTGAQAFVFAVLGTALVLFVWGRWRYDIVAVAALLAVVLGGIVPAERAFSGFAHPAVVTVAAVLVLGRGLRNSGVVDVLSRPLARVAIHPYAHVASLTGLVAALSGFMNNVGALALTMPVALKTARELGRPPSMVLMPLAFGSILGGLTTMIGTPPNLIIANYREDGRRRAVRHVRLLAGGRHRGARRRRLRLVPRLAADARTQGADGA